MSKRTILRCLSIGAPIAILLVSCQGVETPPVPQTPTVTQANASLFSPTSDTTSKTTAATETLIPTRNSAGYTLKDWREPVEVITPENIDRVDKIGEMKFPGGVSRFAWSPDGSWFGVIAHERFVILDASTFTYKWPASGKLVAFSYDGQLLETGIYRYNLVTGEQIGGEESIPLEMYPNSVLDAEFSPDGKFIAAGGTEIAQIYPMSSGIEGGEFGRYPASSIHASISTDSRIVAINYDIETFTELWDPYLRQPVRRLKLKDISGQGKPRFTKDGKSLFVTGNGTWDGREVTYFQEWNYQTGKPLDVQIIPGISMEKGASMDISPVSMVAALGTMQGNIYLLPLRDCKPRRIGRNGPPDDPVYMVAIRPDGKLIATVGWNDSSIEFWGISESDGGVETVAATEDTTETPTVCPKIPMIVENSTPEDDWFGGGRPYIE